MLSLPEGADRTFRIHIEIQKGGIVTKAFKHLMSLPKLTKPVKYFDGQHYWEIGCKGYSLKKITQGITSVGFIVHKTFRVFEHPYHRFFVLAKTR